VDVTRASLEPYSDEGVNAFADHILRLKDRVLQMSGQLEFAEADAKLRVVQIQTQRAELGALAADLRKTSIELNIVRNDRGAKTHE
jgi:hypothetical protein